MINSSHLVVSHCLVSFNSDSFIHSMSHRLWIAALMNFASLISWFISWFIDCLSDDLIGWLITRLIDWLTGVSGANGRSGLNGWPRDWLTEVGGVDGPSDRWTGRPWFSGVRGLNDGCSTKGLSDSSIASSSDGLTEGLSGSSSRGPSGCFEFSVVEMCSALPTIEECSGFSMMKNDCLSVDWFSDEDDEEVDCLNNCSSGCSPDCSPGWPPGYSSSWLCGGGWVGRGAMSGEVGSRLYDEMRCNRLYNCLLNTDEDDEEVDCLNSCSFGCSSDCSPDCSSDCSSGCFSSWCCGGRWDERSDDWLYRSVMNSSWSMITSCFCLWRSSSEGSFK